MKAIMFIGSNAPNRDSQLKVSPQYRGFAAYWEDGMDICGDPGCDCRSRIIVGYGDTEAEAIADYWEQWEERQIPGLAQVFEQNISKVIRGY